MGVYTNAQAHAPGGYTGIRIFMPGGMKLTSAGYDADGKKVVNLDEGTENSDAVTKHQVETALTTKVDKRMEDHLDANYHSILNIQTAGDNDAFSLFHGKTVFLTTDGNEFDAKNQKIGNLQDGSDAATKLQVDTLENKLIQLRADSLQVDGSSHMTGDLDLRGQKLINPGEIEMNRKLITNLDTDENNDLSAVNMITLKKFHSNTPAPTHEITKDLDLKHNFSVINAKQFGDYSHYKVNYDQLMPFEDIRHGFLSRREVTPMAVDLNMDHNRIYNIRTPRFDGEAAPKGYVDTAVATLDTKVDSVANNALPLRGGKMRGQLDMGGYDIQNLRYPQGNYNPTPKLYVDAKDQANKTALEKLVKESHISTTSHPKDEFRYLMQDEDESSSEQNISVTGIVDFESSPHLFNKKAYSLKIDKRSSDNVFYGRIGFNMYKIPEGEYTICIEFFPAKMAGVSVNCVSTALNVGQQTTKTMKSYTRSIVHMHKWRISPPEYLYVDIEWQGEAEDSSPGDAHLIIYGIKESQSDVPSAVFDAPFALQSGKMVMETDLDLNGNALLNYTPKSRAILLGSYQRGHHSGHVILNSFFQQVGDYGESLDWAFTLKQVSLYVRHRVGRIDLSKLSMTLSHGVTSANSISTTVPGKYAGHSNTLVFNFDTAIPKNSGFWLELNQGGNIVSAKAAVIIEM